jgi:hypothetical protein
MEFRAPEFTASLTLANQGPGIMSELGYTTEFTVNASYYSGGPLPNARVHWTFLASQSEWKPKSFKGFLFSTRQWGTGTFHITFIHMQ